MLNDLIRFPEGKTASLNYNRFREICEINESENEIVISNTTSFNYLPAFSYALHSKSMCKESNLYWSLVEKLVNENYTIYLTDTFKLYFKYNGSRSCNISKFTNPKETDIHQEIFAKEINEIKPDLIVTLGSKPRIWFTNIKKAVSFKNLLSIFKDENDLQNKNLYCKRLSENIPVLPLMHLAARKKRI